MNAVKFEQANIRFGPPEGTDESQVRSIDAFVGTVDRGSMEGASIVVTAWSPSLEELKQLNAGQPVFITFLGGCPPHFLSSSFAASIAPA